MWSYCLSSCLWFFEENQNINPTERTKTKVIKKILRLESLYKKEILIGITNDKLNSISRIPKRLEIALRFIRF